jgi:protein-tyrosine phosphatase
MPIDLAAPRRLNWEACRNVRDLGGIATADGATTRWRAVVRADNLCRLSPEGRRALLAYGIRLVIDLRSQREMAQELHPYGPPHSGEPIYLHLPASGDEPQFSPDPSTPGMLGETYVRALAARRPQFVAILRTIASAPQGGVLIHCNAGKDRAGLVSALLLSLAGVADSEIVADYAQSGPCLGDFDEELRREAEDDPGVYTRLAVQRFSPPEAMERALTFLRGEYRGAESYLLDAGGTWDDLERLRSRMRGHG